MISRYSSRRNNLNETYLNEKLKNAVSYDRIAGYFCSSILEIAGESMEKLSGKARIICNSNLKAEDVKTASYANVKMKQEWCEFTPEEKYSDELHPQQNSMIY